MNTITIDQFSDIITKFNLTTDMKYKFKLTRESKKPPCFHTDLEFIDKGSYSYYQCSNPYCREDFNDRWDIRETDLKNELKSEAIQKKKNLIRKKNPSFNVNSLKDRSLNQKYKETLNKIDGLYHFDLELPSATALTNQFKEFLKFLSENHIEEFKTFMIDIFKHAFSTNNVTWINKTFKAFKDNFRELFTKINLNDLIGNGIITQ